MVVEAEARGVTHEGCIAAALLSERDIRDARTLNLIPDTRATERLYVVRSF
ncbi:MAG: hypothetical protein WKF84_11680 [Pyrinomonadaceae bacterium]